MSKQSDLRKEQALEYHSSGRPGKIEVVHNGIDWNPPKGRPEWTPTLPFSKMGRKMVLFVGRLTLQKGADHFLKAAAIVLRHEPNTIFIIAGAGGAAHLPGMTAALTPLPVIGVPIKSSNSIDGWDSILSILQMPGGIPVATVALNGAKNAGILAAKIVSVENEALQQRLIAYMQEMKEMVLESGKDMN